MEYIIGLDTACTATLAIFEAVFEYGVSYEINVASNETVQRLPVVSATDRFYTPHRELFFIHTASNDRRYTKLRALCNTVIQPRDIFV